ncbi:MAG TPA: MFS transporter, partial [Ardenticatenaceae bacterium]|nr:MFS transporter [Ardenticatenaceae bacterium]
GVWVDRARRRPILIAADLGRALLLLTLPLAAFGGVLRIEQLYVVVALVATLGVFFDTAYHAILPSLLSRERLAEGNSRLAMSESLAESVGPGAAGALVQVISAPLTILLDALSFAVSALSLWLIRAPEAVVEATEGRQSVLEDIGAGLRALRDDERLRTLLGAALTLGFSGGIIGTLYGVYGLRELGLSPFVLGVVIGLGGVGALAGSFLAEPAGRRFGYGRAMTGAMVFGAVLQFGIPLARGALSVPLLVVAQILGDVGMSIFAIHERTLRQAITPDRLLGRVNASQQFLLGLVLPVGALCGGWLGERFGLRTAIAIGVGGLLVASLWLLRSPLRRLEALPGSRD